ncbi:hypothetical protein TI39_contig669g00020 [Zymoseptoria brevis]|uniref:Uncharacterized protein n=1 Tax=Zymoseptoria brevis TaxID=1047168 RepID=A0A0F4GFY8_9PEZI|nr:hypothetical protein TI39_contig669g00020 [Zymoseptoria brevis]
MTEYLSKPTTVRLLRDAAELIVILRNLLKATEHDRSIQFATLGQAVEGEQAAYKEIEFSQELLSAATASTKVESHGLVQAKAVAARLATESKTLHDTCRTIMSKSGVGCASESEIPFNVARMMAKVEKFNKLAEEGEWTGDRHSIALSKTDVTMGSLNALADELEGNEELAEAAAGRLEVTEEEG